VLVVAIELLSVAKGRTIGAAGDSAGEEAGLPSDD
jgi:hypothetical protein